MNIPSQEEKCVCGCHENQESHCRWCKRDWDKRIAKSPTVKATHIHHGWNQEGIRQCHESDVVCPYGICQRPKSDQRAEWEINGELNKILSDFKELPDYYRARQKIKQFVAESKAELLDEIERENEVFVHDCEYGKSYTFMKRKIDELKSLHTKGSVSDTDVTRKIEEFNKKRYGVTKMDVGVTEDE